MHILAPFTLIQPLLVSAYWASITLQNIVQNVGLIIYIQSEIVFEMCVLIVTVMYSGIFCVPIRVYVQG